MKRLRNLLLCAALLPVGCAYVLPGVPVTVHLPEEPHPWEQAGAALSYRIEYLDGEGRRESARLPPGRRSVKLRLGRRLSCPVIALPAGRLPPAGGFAGAAEGSGEVITGRRTLRLSWREGAAAQLMLSLAAAGLQPDVDGTALAEEMERKGGGDPWRCDTGELRTVLALGIFSRRHVDALPEREVLLPLSGEGWVAANPLFRGKVVSHSEGVTVTGMYAGIHAFYRPASGTAALIQAEKRGDTNKGVRVFLEPLCDFGW